MRNPHELAFHRRKRLADTEFLTHCIPEINNALAGRRRVSGSAYVEGPCICDQDIRIVARQREFTVTSARFADIERLFLHAYGLAVLVQSTMRERRIDNSQRLQACIAFNLEYASV